jgi:hypothetical protein
MMMYGLQDRLVLYIEEDYYGKKDASCYVLYDYVEREYFICGARLDERKTTYSKFHFYCKSIESLLDYIAFIMNARDSRITYGLINYNNIFKNTELMDFDAFDKRRVEINENNEIAVYVNMDFNKKQIRRLLGVLRDVRY